MEMRQHCDNAGAQLKLTEEASRSLLEQAESLRSERWDTRSHPVSRSYEPRLPKAGGGNAKVHRVTLS